MKIVNSSVRISSFNCGFDTMIGQIVNISLKFFLSLIFFIIFDVELMLIYRFICLNRRVYIIIYLTVVILIIRYLYEINEGLLR